MKHILKTIALCLLAGWTSVSCELQRDPLTALADNNFWTSQENAMLALTGIYRGKNQMSDEQYGPSDWWSYAWGTLMDGATDLGYDRRDLTGAVSIFTHNGPVVNNNNNLKALYQNSYKRVFLCNEYIENVDKTPAPAAFIERTKAEARFLRACQYHYLAFYFVDVPLVTKTLSIEEANSVKKATQAEIYAFVEKEFSEVAAILPGWKSLTGGEMGRATKQAAWAFLGRTYLQQKKFAQAAAVFKQIIDLGENALADDYASLFIPTNENCSEMIFSLQHVQDVAGNGILQQIWPVKNGGWALACPTGNLFAFYEFTDGTPFSYTDPRYTSAYPNLGKNRDPRLEATLLYNGSMFKGTPFVSHPDVSSPDKLAAAAQVTRTGFLLRKFADENYNGDLRNTGINVPVIRYADVLLLYLEAKLEAGEAIDQTLLDETINKVRGRKSVGLPKITDTNPATLRTRLRNERVVELAFEGSRMWDLYRWGIAEQVLTCDIWGCAYPDAKPASIRKKGTATDPHARWYVNSRKFIAGSERFPIPQDEVNVNPNLR